MTHPGPAPAGLPDDVPADTLTDGIISWHITTRCQNRCRHCYMFDPATWPSESANELDRDDLYRVLDSILTFEKDYGAYFRYFTLGGGDPLLRPEWRELAGRLRGLQRDVTLMGNPETLTPENLAHMAELGITMYQLSLDGLEATHDALRQPGSWRRTIDAVTRLKAHGIRTGLMFTLSATNRDDLFPLIDFIADATPADSFAVDLCCPVGNGRDLALGLDPAGIAAYCRRYLQRKDELQASGSSLVLAEKMAYMRLIRFERGELYPSASAQLGVVAGCVCGWAAPPILADGSIVPCRRVPVRIGKMPEQSFAEIFLGSKLLRQFRRREFFTGCGNCDFYAICRGCPGAAYAASGDPFARNPYCFRDLLPATTVTVPRPTYSLPMDATCSEEYRLITRHFSSYLRQHHDELLWQPAVLTLLVELAGAETRRRDFLRDPQRYCGSRHIVLDDVHLTFVLYLLHGIAMGWLQPASLQRLAAFQFSAPA